MCGDGWGMRLSGEYKENWWEGKRVGQKGVRLAEEVWTRGRCRETVIAELFIVLLNLVGRQIDK
jgi:hypothetical protein